MRVILALLTLTAATATAAPPPPKWSATADGVHARIVVGLGIDAQKRPQIEVALEIENVSDVDGGLPLPWGYVGDMLAFELVDDTGKPVAAGSSMGGSYASGPPYVVALPVGAVLHLPISKAAIEYAGPKHTLFRPLTFQGWDLPAKHGKLFLRAKLSPHALDATANPLPARAWKTKLELPAVELP